MNPTDKAVDITAIEIFTGIFPVYRIHEGRLIELARVDTNVVVSRLSDGVILHRHIRDAYSRRGYCPGLGLPGDACEDPSGIEGATSRAEFTVPARIAAGDGLAISNHCAAIDGVDTPIHVEVMVQGTHGGGGDGGPPGPAPQRAWVANLYADVLGRDADQAGLDGWSEYLAANCSHAGFEHIGRTFYGSQEFQELRAHCSTADIMRSFYLAFLDREPDGAGWAVWNARLDAARAQGAQAAFLAEAVSGFVGSSEFSAKVPGICG